jgi:hypothetical protein
MVKNNAMDSFSFILNYSQHPIGSSRAFSQATFCYLSDAREMGPDSNFPDRDYGVQNESLDKKSMPYFSIDCVQLFCNRRDTLDSPPGVMARQIERRRLISHRGKEKKVTSGAEAAWLQVFAAGVDLFPKEDKASHKGFEAGSYVVCPASMGARILLVMR